MCNINNNEVLFRYANPEAFPPGQKEIPLSIFNDPELSCDWEHYQKHPENSIHVTENKKTIIVSITVCDEICNPRNPKGNGDIVNDWKQKIYHVIKNLIL